MRAYLRLDPNLRKQKRSYPDGAFRAFVETLCAAEAQPFRGRFESRAILKALLGPRARWITYLIEHNDLALVDSEIEVVGWSDWQEGDITVPERMARLRAKKAAKVTGTDTATVTPPVTVPVTTPRIAEAVSGKPEAVGEAEAEVAARNDVPPTMGFQPPKRGARPMASLSSVLDQHNRDFDPCAVCGQRRGGAAHAPGRADHPFQERGGA